MGNNYWVNEIYVHGYVCSMEKGKKMHIFCSKKGTWARTRKKDHGNLSNSQNTHTHTQKKIQRLLRIHWHSRENPALVAQKHMKDHKNGWWAQFSTVSRPYNFRGSSDVVWIYPCTKCSSKFYNWKTIHFAVACGKKHITYYSEGLWVRRSWWMVCHPLE